MAAIMTFANRLPGLLDRLECVIFESGFGVKESLPAQSAGKENSL
jgi:hypothetical protein